MSCSQHAFAHPLKVGVNHPPTSEAQSHLEWQIPLDLRT